MNMVSQVIAPGPSLDAGKLALTAIGAAIQKLYGMTVAINEYLDKHIEDMKGSENPTISRTGRVIEMAKYGFGLGYITPVVIIATGQLLLGNTFAAGAVVVTAATLSNPIAMTCGAVGAVYYGWGALSDVEREELLDKLSKGLEIGIEFVKSVVRFVIEKTKELMSAKNLDEIKKYVASTAESFGRTLSDVTRKVSDMVSEGLGAVKTIAGQGVDKAGELANTAYGSAKEIAQKSADGAREAIKKVKRGKGDGEEPAEPGK